MAVSMKDLGIDRLSVDDRIALAQEIWDSVSEEVEKRPLSDAQRAEIDRRLAAHESNPDAAIPYEEVMAAALARLNKS